LQSKLLADENIPWPLVRLLRDMGIDIVWIPETAYRGVSDEEIVDLANSGGRIILTRDRDFLRMRLRRKVEYGLIYIGEPARKDNLVRLSGNIIRALEFLDRKPPGNSHINHYRATPSHTVTS